MILNIINPETTGARAHDSTIARKSKPPTEATVRRGPLRDDRVRAGRRRSYE